MKNNKLLKTLGNLDLYISVVAISMLVIVTFLGVIMRYFVGQPFVWQEEVQLGLITWVIFLGGSAAFRGANHIAMEMVVDLFPKGVQKAFDAVIYLIVTGVLAFVGINALRLVIQFSNTHRQTNILHIPSQYIYFIIPLGCLLMIVSNTCDTYQRMRGKSQEEEAVE